MRRCGCLFRHIEIARSNAWHDHFCIAVVGHEGWSHDPDSSARYALAVTLQILGEEIAIYEPLQTAVIELQTEVEAVAEVEAEAEVEVEE